MNPPSYTRQKYLLAILVFLYVIIITRPWDLYFLNDDFVHIPLSTKTIWVHFFFFRPIANIITAIEVKLYGNNPFGFHITSILLHIATSYFVTLLANTLLQRYGNPERYPHAGFLIGCLFFIYPFHSEPLLWVIGRISIIASLFYVLSLIFFLKSTKWYYQVISVLIFIPALFTYEISWTLPLVITALAITDRYKTKMNWLATVRSILPHWIVFALFLGLRSALLHRVFTEYDVEKSDLNILTLIANFFRLVARTAVPPHQSTTVFMIAFLIVAAALMILAIYLFKKKALTAAHVLLACILGITYLPVISFGIDTHGTEGERYLYLPSIFWIILLVWMLYDLPSRTRMLAFTFIFVFYASSLASSAKVYQHASHIARTIMQSVHPPVPVKNIVAVNVPANYKGAMIYRIPFDFDKPLRWMRPDIQFDSAIAIVAPRTYEKIPDTIHEIKYQDLPSTQLPLRKTGTGTIQIEYNGETIPYSPSTDMLLFFPPGKPGIIVYPEKPAS